MFTTVGKITIIIMIVFLMSCGTLQGDYQDHYPKGYADCLNAGGENCEWGQP